MSDFVNKTIGQLVKDTATRNPEKYGACFVRSSENDKTSRQFYKTCRDVAKGLMAMGIKRGDNVAVWTTNLSRIGFICSLLWE